jgi:hypothetical protein
MIKNKTFFFEKKNQKTFAPLREQVKQPDAKMTKVFLFLFVYKKKFSLHYPFFRFFLPLGFGVAKMTQKKELP